MRHIHIHVHTHDAALGRWVTVSGARVFIEGGKITKGPSALLGRGEHGVHAEHHDERHAHHAKEAEARGEDMTRPAHGSHAEASSHHRSAAFLHRKADTEPSPDNTKKAYRQTSIAHSASKKTESEKDYPEQKANESATAPADPRVLQAKRIDRYLRQRHIGPIKR